MKVCLWREAAVSKISVGEIIMITHVTSYGPPLQTTTFSQIEVKEEEIPPIVIIGTDAAASGGSGENFVELFEEDKCYMISAEMGSI